MINELIAQFWIPTRVVPKQRPQVSSNGVYYKENYVDWMDYAVTEICCQKYLSDYQTPQSPVKVESQFVNFRLGDCDNLEGACLDALVRAGYLLDDGSKYVVDNRGFFSLRRARKNQPKVVGCIIKVFSHPGIVKISKEDWDFISQVDNVYFSQIS